METNKPSIEYLLWAGLVTLIASLLLNYIQHRQSLKAEKIQFESNLILSAIEKSDIDVTLRNLEVLINSGLISKSNDKIIFLLNDTTFKAQFPERITVSISPTNTIELVSGLERIDQRYSFNSRGAYIKNIIGKVTDESGLPLDSASVYINPCKNRFDNTIQNCFAKTYTDTNGLFVIIAPNKGSYELFIKMEGYEVIAKYYSASQSISLDAEFRLKRNK